MEWCQQTENGTGEICLRALTTKILFNRTGGQEINVKKQKEENGYFKWGIATSVCWPRIVLTFLTSPPGLK
jgi:hypothetical protein